MNNKGFAITSIIYAILVLFLMVLLSMLAILSNQKNMSEDLIDGESGARSITNLEKIDITKELLSGKYTIPKTAMYYYIASDWQCKFYAYKGDEITILSNYYISINGTCECNCQGETPSSSNPNTGKESRSKITSSSSSSSSNAKVS